MNKNILTVVGITILFLGLSIQPAVAVTPISSDSEEDCSICPKVSNLQDVEKYRELSDRIATIKELNKGLKPDRDFPIICNILTKLLIYELISIFYLYNLMEYYNDNQIISSILEIWHAVKVMISLPPLYIFFLLNCPPFIHQ